jgi:hypothetical protein
MCICARCAADATRGILTAHAEAVCDQVIAARRKQFGGHAVREA